MSIPTPIEQLIDRFHDDPRRYQSSYNETEARIHFINPLFVALGWDMDNARGRGEVKHEDRVLIHGKSKAPDYGFRLDGRLRFFVEAKKPSVNLDQQIDPAYQLRRYAWTAKLPLSVLTDFEEFAVYDTRVRPNPADSPKVARLRYWRYDQYPDVWGEIAAAFSRDAVLAGSLEQYAADVGGKKGIGPRGVATVDAEFLKEIERWRDLLARNLALRNPALDERGLNFAVQQTIDRLLFLRIAEDRGIEPYGRLRDLATGGDVYSRLFLLFNQADARYNSGLFHFGYEKGRGEPDTLTPALNIDDKALKDIIRNLYEPVSPYEFSVFPADILGQVYEQFLGKVIRLAGKRAVVEEKPEVRKAGGVYYTPTYIVDYIVRQTVGKLLEGHAPDPSGPASRLRVLDPACGSGSFLLGAYRYLLDWHLRGYLAAPSKWSKGRNRTLHQTAAGEYHLTLAERKRILLDNLYGVDIDPQAVEVTKLSLLLRVLEDTPDALTGQMALLPERVLPDLGDNIKCGNSLIGPDFYNQSALFPDDAMLRINAFDWRAEFREIMTAGGFDAVIGNPPYVRQEMLSESKNYFSNHYAVYASTADLYTYFIERGISLLKPGGMFGYIVANKWMRSNYGHSLRDWLSNKHIIQIVDFGDLPIFQGATTYPCIIVVQNEPTKGTFISAHVKSMNFGILEDFVRSNEIIISQEKLNPDGWALIPDSVSDLIEKLASIGTTFGRYVNDRIYYGIKTGLNEAFVIDGATRAQMIAQDPKGAELIKPFLAGRDIKRFEITDNDRYVILIPKGWTNSRVRRNQNPLNWLKHNYPSIAAHLLQFEDAAQKRTDQGEYWWELRACDYYDVFEKPKFFVPDIAIRGNFAFDASEGYHCVNTAYVIPSDDMYLLGILNSKLITFFYSHISPAYRGGYFRFIYQYLIQLPIRTIDFTNPADTARHARMVELVERMLDLHQRHAAEGNPQMKTMLQRQIDAADKQIDALVYALYGLTDDEIAIVEA